MSSVAPGGIACAPGGMFVPFTKMRRPVERTQLGTHKRKSSSCPGRPPGMEPGYFSSAPSSSPNPSWATFLQDLSSSVCKIGACGQMDSRWAAVARSGGEREKQVNRWWPHSPGAQVSVYRLSSRRKHPLGMGQESDCVVLTVCRGTIPLCFAKGCSLLLSLVLKSLFCSCMTLTCSNLPFWCFRASTARTRATKTMRSPQ